MITINKINGEYVATDDGIPYPKRVKPDADIYFEYVGFSRFYQEHIYQTSFTSELPPILYYEMMKDNNIRVCPVEFLSRIKPMLEVLKDRKYTYKFRAKATTTEL